MSILLLLWIDCLGREERRRGKEKEIRRKEGRIIEKETRGRKGGK